MHVHVTTNYFCNYNCEYCYLGELRKSKTTIDFNKLQFQLQELNNRYDLTYIDCYGGEITLLNNHYAAQIINYCKNFARTSWVTNLSNPQKAEDLAKRTKVKYATSVNSERPQNQDILNKVLLMESKPNSIIQVVTPSLMKMSPKEVLEQASLFGTEYVGFVQYFASTANSFTYLNSASNTPNKDYCNFLKEILKEYFAGDYNFKIENKEALDDVINSQYTPWMNNAIFITPNNQYACVLYNDRDGGKEHFRILKNLDEYDEITKNEKEKYSAKCHGCELLGYCYAEHLRAWNNNDECCGNKSLVEWYKRVVDAKNIHKNN